MQVARFSIVATSSRLSKRFDRRPSPLETLGPNDDRSDARAVKVTMQLVRARLNFLRRTLRVTRASFVIRSSTQSNLEPRDARPTYLAISGGRKPVRFIG